MTQYQTNIYILFLLLIIIPTNSQYRARPTQRQFQSEPSDMRQNNHYPSSSRNIDHPNNYQSSSINYNQQSKHKAFDYTLWVLLLLLFIVTFAYMKKREIWIIKDIFRREMNRFKQQVLVKPLKMSEKDKQTRILAFKENLYIMTNNFTDPLLNFKTEMKLIKIEKVQDRLYEVKYQCKDINGVSNCQGLVALTTHTEFAIKIIKIYTNFTHMGEKIKKQKRLIFYEGKGTLSRLTGKWYYYGYQTQDNSTGQFEMS